MTDLPAQIEIHEEGPREGFQIEPGPICTADKIKLVATWRRHTERGLETLERAQLPRPAVPVPANDPRPMIDPRPGPVVVARGEILSNRVESGAQGAGE